MSNLIKGTAFLIIILLAVFFYQGNINEFPQHIHGWSQSDRYALAIGFLNNGFDFFHPQTFNLNVQFEPANGLKNYTGITAVDFPLHEYLVAILMHFFGVAPWVFRCYTLLYVLVGLYFLARIGKQLGLDNLWAWFMPVFVLTTPVFTYYANGFLPGTTAWATACIGFYFYVLYLQHQQKKHWILALTFFTLAALTRTPFIMCLLAIALVQLIYDFKSSRCQRMFWLFFMAAITIIVGYAFYNNYLRKVYGSIFLSTPMPARNFAEFKQIAADICKQWLFQYFSLGHYLVWLACVLTLTVTIFKTKLNGWLGQFAWVQVILFGGASCYALLMWRQMQQHDYYFIDTFLLPLVLLLAVAGRITTYWPKSISVFLVLTLTTWFTFKSKQVQAMRNSSGPWDRYLTTLQNFESSASWLTKNGVPATASILVIDAYAPNMPFILMDRKGFAVITTSAAAIKNALQYPFDYLVMQNQFVRSDVLVNYPQLQNMFLCAASNGKISLYKKSKQPVNQSLAAFLGFGNRQPTAAYNFDIELPTMPWNLQASKINETIAGNNQWLAFVDSNHNYPVTLTLKAPQTFVATQSFLIDVDVYGLTTFDEVFLSTYAGHDTIISYQDYMPLLPQAQTKLVWHHFSALVNLPVIARQDEIRLFLWNPKGQKFYFKNLQIKQWQ